MKIELPLLSEGNQLRDPLSGGSLQQQPIINPNESQNSPSPCPQMLPEVTLHPTDRGVEWEGDKGGKHLVNFGAVYSFRARMYSS